MSRARKSTRVRGVVAAAVAIAVAAPVAAAQTGAPTLVVDRAPKRVGYRQTAIVKARLQNGAPGDEVAIEKRVGEWWKLLQTKPVDDEGRVTFRLRDRRTSSTYRVSWTDPLSEAVTTSESFRVRVRPQLTLRSRPRHPYAGERIVLRGTLRPAERGRRVVLQRRVSGEWRTMGRAGAGDGTFRFGFSAPRAGRNKVRAVFRGDEGNTSRTRSRAVTVFDPDLATWYGPGFYGNSTACGRRLTRGTLGVAHRSLPCGTMVRIAFRGRTIRVPVIDRGPYTSAEWDLTEETANRIGFSGKQTIGTAL
ncbi:MAG TPA: septal ring lytic transglycosylase RlpA family protein [Actinomycetota bacterium]|jgi:rare lipoprotein A|nr:septal ring lytic transglycosylase RlpA family protein [Actinomycetota bacterium]